MRTMLNVKARANSAARAFTFLAEKRVRRDAGFGARRVGNVRCKEIFATFSYRLCNVVAARVNINQDGQEQG